MRQCLLARQAVSPTANPENSTEMQTSELFNAPDADVIFRSSDGVLFHIHSTNLSATTGGFPKAAEFPPRSDEYVHLTENASTLDLLFQFIYPQRQPALDKLKFADLAFLSEAAEKYQVYPAMQVCMVYMSKVLPDHATEVLDYAVKHDYPDLMDKAAPHASLLEISRLATKVSPLLLQTWVPYHNERISVFQLAFGDQWGQSHLDHSHHYDIEFPVTCSLWGTSYPHIIVALARMGGNPDIDSTFSLINVPTTSSQCCRSAAEVWRQNMLTRSNAITKFSAFLAARS